MNDSRPHIAVLSGGPSAERDVSLVSGRAVVEALRAQSHSCELIELTDASVPAHLDPKTTIIFPAMHGAFGEDGGLQSLLEEAGFAYVGSDAKASALCMDKVKTKALLTDHPVFSLPGEVVFNANDIPKADVLVEALGEQIVIKPSDSGSSVGLYFANGRDELNTILMKLTSGNWLAESCIQGREMSIGILNGEALDIVEIVPEGGHYDYHHKYTKGATEYRVPASVSAPFAKALAESVEDVFKRCGCHDFARLDFILDQAETPYFLEINTIPGLTSTSLLPKSASKRGYTFETLIEAMIQPAIKRFSSALPSRHGT